MITIITAEFKSTNKPDPDNLMRFFPETGNQIILYTEKDLPSVFAHDSRWGWHQHDYWLVRKMLDVEDGIVLGFDADMRVVSPEIRSIIPLAEKFGFCLPSNPRHLVKIDTLIGTDSDGQLDETQGSASAVNTAFYAFDTTNKPARTLLEEFCRLMLDTPLRAPLVMWRAIYNTGIMPCILPPQWCVCADDIGVGNEIILHIGHKEVKEFYKIQ